MDAKKTGELIAQCRKARGLSQGELASRLHVTDKAVSKWETGRGMPGIDTLEPLAEALGLSVSELLSGQRLTAEELPKAADGQIVESMRTGVRRARLGVLAALAAVGILAVLAVGLYRTAHYRASVVRVIFWRFRWENAATRYILVRKQERRMHTCVPPFHGIAVYNGQII